MTQKNIILGVVVVVVLGIVGYVFFVRDVIAPENNPPIAPGQNEEQSSGYVSEAFTRTYADGVHTVRGVVLLPTPCHQVESNVRIAESFPEQVFVDLTVRSDDGVCIQVIDEREVEVTFEASPEAGVRITLHGADVPLAE